MAKVVRTITTEAAPEAVWALVSDGPKIAEWNSMHDAFTSDVPSTLEAGSAYKQRVKMMGMPAEIAWRVATADAPGRLELNGDGPMGIKAINRFILAPAGDGTEITYEIEFNGPALNGPMAMMAEKNAGTAAEASLAKFKALLG